MNFLRYQGARGRFHLAVETDDGVYDLAACYRQYRDLGGPHVPGIKTAFARASLRLLLALPSRAFLDAVRMSGAQCRAPALLSKSLVLGAPLHDPGRFIGVGLNYREHAREVGQALPAQPPLFAKWNNAITGPRSPVVLPQNSAAVDYEVELGIVIGSRALRVAPHEALECVFGYTIINDVSARDLQFKTSQWLAGKIADGFAPMGPAVVEKGDIPSAQGLTLETWVNGERRQHGHTSDMVYDVAALVSYLSHLIALEPGDIIASGTPAGVGMSRTPPTYLKSGDVVRMSITGLGTLENTFRAA